MARPATGREFIEAAKEQIATAKTADALRAAQALLLPLEFGLSLQQTATAIGLSKRWTTQLRTRFQRIETGIEHPAKTKKELRNHARMTLDEETQFLAPFIEKARNAGIIIVPPLQAELERRLGRSVAPSTVYRLLQRHGWRKLAPDKQHPKADPVAQDAFKKTPRRNQSGAIPLQKHSAPEAHVPGRGSFWPNLQHSPLLVSEAHAPHGSCHGHSGVYLCLRRRLARGRHTRYLDTPLRERLVYGDIPARSECATCAGKYPDGARRCGLAQKPVRPFACQSSTLVLAAVFART